MNADKMSLEDLLCDESFINYCKGISKEDTGFWEDYIKANPSRRFLIEHAREQYIQLVNTLAQADLEEQTVRLQNYLEYKDAIPVIQMDHVEKKERGRLLPLLFRITAAAMVLAGLFFAINYFVAGRNNNKIYSAAYGERKNIQLPDGTIVTLNAGSNIKINDQYGIAIRDIYLEGEAFFEVKHDSTRPFIVHTPAMDVKALGTAFNVKAYRDEKITETSLIRGLVEITLKQNNNLKMLLYPNQKIAWQLGADKTPVNNQGATKNAMALKDVNSLKKNLEVNNTGDIKEIAWKANKLIFDDEEFGDIAVLLERWYGVKINFRDNALRSYRFTGIFEKEDLNTVLDFLKESRSFNYTIEKDESLTVNLFK